MSKTKKDTPKTSQNPIKALAAALGLSTTKTEQQLTAFGKSPTMQKAAQTAQKDVKKAMDSTEPVKAIKTDIEKTSKSLGGKLYDWFKGHADVEPKKLDSPKAKSCFQKIGAAFSDALYHRATIEQQKTLMRAAFKGGSKDGSGTEFQKLQNTMVANFSSGEAWAGAGKEAVKELKKMRPEARMELLGEMLTQRYTSMSEAPIALLGQSLEGHRASPELTKTITSALQNDRKQYACELALAGGLKPPSKGISGAVASVWNTYKETAEKNPVSGTVIEFAKTYCREMKNPNVAPQWKALTQIGLALNAAVILVGYSPFLIGSAIGVGAEMAITETAKGIARSVSSQANDGKGRDTGIHPDWGDLSNIRGDLGGSRGSRGNSRQW